MTTQSGLALLEDQLESRNGVRRPNGAAAGTSLDMESKLPLVAVAVESNQDRSRLVQLLDSLNVGVIAHKSLATLRRSLLRDEVDLVITDVTLPDGNWIDVLRLTFEASTPPGIIVHSRLVNDRLWSEVLWRGAYDMLIAPYSTDDGCAIIEGALRTGCLLARSQPIGMKH